VSRSGTDLQHSPEVANEKERRRKNEVLGGGDEPKEVGVGYDQQVEVGGGRALRVVGEDRKREAAAACDGEVVQAVLAQEEGGHGK
jgi:hypothetical protein